MPRRGFTTGRSGRERRHESVPDRPDPSGNLLFTAGCQREATDYISINGKVFIFNIRYGRAFDMLTLNRLPSNT